MSYQRSSHPPLPCCILSVLGHTLVASAICLSHTEDASISPACQQLHRDLPQTYSKRSWHMTPLSSSTTTRFAMRKTAFKHVSRWIFRPGHAPNFGLQSYPAVLFANRFAILAQCRQGKIRTLQHRSCMRNLSVANDTSVTNNYHNNE